MTINRRVQIAGFAILALVAPGFAAVPCHAQSTGMPRLESALRVLPPSTPSTDDVNVSLALKTMHGEAATATAQAIAHGDPIERNTYVTVCFTASKTGFVTLWDIDALQNITRIFPNQYTRGGVIENAYPVEADRETCVATGRDFSLRADGEGGASSLTLIWTADAGSNLAQDQFANAVVAGDALRQESTMGSGFKKVTIGYELVD